MVRRVMSPEELSTSPAQIRIRLRRNFGKKNPASQAAYKRDLEMYTEHRDYWKPVEKWDAEELARGRPRDKGGEFRGMTPKWITPEVQKEAKRRLMETAFGKLAGHVDAAVQTIFNLMTSEEVDEKGKPIVDARTQLAAAMFIVEHIVGKPKAVLEVGADDTIRTALAAAIVLDDGKPQDHMVFEGSIVEEDEGEDDDGGE